MKFACEPPALVFPGVDEVPGELAQLGGAQGHLRRQVLALARLLFVAVTQLAREQNQTQHRDQHQQMQRHAVEHDGVKERSACAVLQ